MKRVAIVVILVVSAACLGMWRSHGGMRQALMSSNSDGSQGDARDEIRKSFDLQPGARVEVQGINGKVEIQTSDTRTAEIYVLRKAKSNESLSRREVVIEQTANGFLVRGRQNRHAGFWEHLFGSNPTEEVTIKAPRQIALSLRGINGRVSSGDIEGTLEAKGINGRVELGQATESVDISGINGNISVTLNKLGDRGAHVSGVNGGTELRFADGVNADVTANGMNGGMRSEIPGVTVQKDDFGSHYSAQIGKGGSPIVLSGINGNVRLTRSGSATTVSEASTKQDPPKQNPSESKSSKNAQ